MFGVRGQVALEEGDAFMTNGVTTEFLDAFGDAMNRHDLDALMKFMTEDCVFESYAGPDACGTRYEGQEQVRVGFTKIWTACPDAHFGTTSQFICGDRGCLRVGFHGHA